MLRVGLCLLFVFDLWSSVHGSSGREFAINAVDYFQTYESTLQLGDCVRPAAAGGGTVTTNGFKYTGDVEFVDMRSSHLKYDRLTTALDSTTRTMGALSVGVDLLGLVSAEAEGKVTVTIKKKKNTIDMEARLDVTRGMQTLRRPRPTDMVIRDPNKCPFYLSEIIFGGEEKLVVQMELETYSKKREVEIKRTIKVLFFKISVTLRFTTTTQRSSGRVTFWRLSTYFDTKNEQLWSRSYTKEEFPQAIRAVESAEAAMGNLPDTLNAMSLDKLHHKYIFAKAIVGNVFKASVMTSQWAYNNARRQYLELIQSEAEIEDDLLNRAEGFPTSTRQALQNLKNEVTGVRTQLEAQLKIYYNLNDAQLEALPNIYGASRAPGYYHRRHRKILPEEVFTVCENSALAVGGIVTDTANGVKLTECSSSCTARRHCNMFTFKPTTTSLPPKGTCKFFIGQPACNAVSRSPDPDSIAVFVDRLSCTASQLGLSGCVQQSFVQSDPL